MANPAHVAKLRDGVEAWNRWREQNWNVKPDLSGLDLSSEKSFKRTALWDSATGRISLAKANLGWADMHGANLRNVGLQEANLIEANLEGANFQGANLNNATLESANLSQVNLGDATLIGANLKSANLDKADLRSAHLSGASLENASLIEADMRSVQAGAANFSGADLTRADLWTANLSGAQLVATNLEEANLIRADLHKANLKDAILYSADLRDTNMLGVNLDHAGVIGIKYERRFMPGKYQGIRGVESAYGDAIFRRDALDQDYIDTLALRWRRSPMLVVLWLWSLIDYGRSMVRTVWIATLIVAAFGFSYMVNPSMVELVSSEKTWFSPYYASLITFTSLGFSNQVASHTATGQMLLAAEAALGYFIFGVLLAILMHKIARRS